MKDHLRQLVGQEADPLRRRNLVREYLQARMLQAFQEQGAFLDWAFLGGTALRFLYSIPRYSEDLDFSVVDPAREAHFTDRLRGLAARFEAEGYVVDIRANDTKAVCSAFVRFRGLLFELGISAQRAEALAVKVEVDTRPPLGAVTMSTLVRRHVILNLHHYDKASLLAGKLHAILSRPYTKGRDVYDLLWYLADPTWPSPNIDLLNNALQQTGWTGHRVTFATWRKILTTRIRALDWPAAVADVRPFLERQEEVALLNEANCRRLLRAPE